MILTIDKKTNISTILASVDNYLNQFIIKNNIKMEIKTIVSELAYNIKKYTPKGTIKLNIKDNILNIVSSDKGSGIDEFGIAIEDGYSSSGTLGIGLLSIFRLSDEIDIETSNEGTIINIKKSLL